MRTILRESNLDLLGEVERLITALKATPVVPELAPYHDHMVRACADLHEQICHNLRDMELGRDDILPNAPSSFSPGTNGLRNSFATLLV